MKVPFPRPPARTWALTTISSLPSISISPSSSEVRYPVSLLLPLPLQGRMRDILLGHRRHTRNDEFYASHMNVPLSTIERRDTRGWRGIVSGWIGSIGADAESL